MASKKLTDKEVLHIAKLCNITLSSEEVAKLGAMLTQAIDYIEILNELDTSQVEETYQVTGLTNVFQAPNSKPDTLSHTEALANAAEELNGLFATKAIFDRV